jgi:hypothetical protein
MLPLLLVLGTTPADSCPVDGGSDGSGSEDTGDTNAAYERYMRARSKVQQHYEAALLLAIVQGCPELRELEVPWWDPPRAAVVAAAQHLRLLKVLSVAMPPGDSWEDLEQRVVAVRAQAGLRPVDLHLEYPLLF